MKPKHFILCALVVFFFCCSKKRTIECVPPTLKIRVQGFSINEADTVIIREFPPDTTKNDTLSVRMITLTQEYLNNPSVIAELSHLSSWQVELPGAKKTYMISDVILENKQTAITRDKNATCTKEVISVAVNNRKLGTSSLILDKNL